jgi:hypothetical protein
VTAFFALATSLLWGLADFGGGLLTRRTPALTVVVVSQAIAAAVLGTVVAVTCGWGEAGPRLWFAFAAGLAGPVAMICFYKPLAQGPMGVVSPGYQDPFGNAARCGAGPRDPDAHGERTPESGLHIVQLGRLRRGPLVQFGEPGHRLLVQLRERAQLFGGDPVGDRHRRGRPERRLPALRGRPTPYDSGGRPRDHGMVGHDTADHGPGGHDHVRPILAPGRITAPVPIQQPGPISTGSMRGHCLPMGWCGSSYEWFVDVT